MNGRLKHKSERSPIEPSTAGSRARRKSLKLSARQAEVWEWARNEAQKWPGARLVSPGRAGGPPDLTGAFLEALRDSYLVKTGRKSRFARRLIPVVARKQQLLEDGSPKFYSWPIVRGWIHTAFPKEGESSLIHTAIRAVDEDVLAAWTPRTLTRAPTRVVSIESDVLVPRLWYNSWAPTLTTELA